MLAVCCVFVEANVAYTPDYVVRLQSMCRRLIKSPHRFICFTDRPALLPSTIKTITIPKPIGMGWWSKLELFNPQHELKGPGLYLDLDTLIVAPIRPIYKPNTDLVLIPHAGTFNGRDGLAVVKRYNSSVMRFTFGRHPELWTEFNVGTMRRLWGDQDWIGERLPNQPTFPLSWFPRLSEVEKPPRWPDDAKIVLCKRPKNHQALEKWPWFDALWR